MEQDYQALKHAVEWLWSNVCGFLCCAGMGLYLLLLILGGAKRR